MPAVCNNRLKAEFTEDYRTVFEILKSGFSLSDYQFDEWYADTCHRVRHGISRLIVIALRERTRCNGDSAFR